MGKATRQKEVAGYNGPDMTAPSMEEMNKLIIEKVVKKTLEEITLKNGKSPIFTSTPRASSSLAAPKEMRGLLGAKSSSTRTVVGVLMVVAPSRVKTPPRWIDLLLTFAGRWPNRL